MKRFHEKEQARADEHKHKIEDLEQTIKKLENDLYAHSSNYDVIKAREEEIEKTREREMREK